MQRFKIRSSIYDVPAGQLHSLVDDFLAGGLSFRSRLAGYQMFYASGQIELSVETMEEVHPTYHLDVAFRGTTEEVREWVKALALQLNRSGILYLIDWVEVDEAGDEIGDEESMESPDFDARYESFRALK